MEAIKRIANELIEKLQEKNEGYENLNNYDPIVDLIESVSASIFFCQKAIEKTENNNDIEKASGVYLDRIGKFFDLERKESESDEFFRKRIFYFASSLSQRGTKDYLLNEILKISETIQDAQAFNSFEDPDEENLVKSKPGLVFLYPHLKMEAIDFIEDIPEEEKYQSYIEEKELRNSEKKNVLNYLEKEIGSDEKAPIGAVYKAILPKAILVKITIKVFFLLAELNKEKALEAIQKRTAQFFESLESKLGAYFSSTELISYLGKEIQGVFLRIENIEDRILPKPNQYIAIRREFLEGETIRIEKKILVEEGI